nr:MAG TPA: hypothetical protein [Caudoviricetes sp.]DAV73097.1 MAG TPA: hypothetical protein [Caudoviricetes sp.]
MGCQQWQPFAYTRTEALQTLLAVRRQTYRLNTENGSGTALRGCERIVEVYDYCRRKKCST